MLFALPICSAGRATHEDYMNPHSRPFILSSYIHLLSARHALPLALVHLCWSRTHFTLMPFFLGSFSIIRLCP